MVGLQKNESIGESVLKGLSRILKGLNMFDAVQWRILKEYLWFLSRGIAILSLSVLILFSHNSNAAPQDSVLFSGMQNPILVGLLGFDGYDGDPELIDGSPGSILVFVDEPIFRSSPASDRHVQTEILWVRKIGGEVFIQPLHLDDENGGFLQFGLQRLRFSTPSFRLSPLVQFPGSGVWHLPNQSYTPKKNQHQNRLSVGEPVLEPNPYSWRFQKIFVDPSYLTRLEIIVEERFTGSASAQSSSAQNTSLASEPKKLAIGFLEVSQEVSGPTRSLEWLVAMGAAKNLPLSMGQDFQEIRGNLERLDFVSIAKKAERLSLEENKKEKESPRLVHLNVLLLGDPTRQYEAMAYAFAMVPNSDESYRPATSSEFSLWERLVILGPESTPLVLAGEPSGDRSSEVLRFRHSWTEEEPPPGGVFGQKPPRLKIEREVLLRRDFLRALIEKATDSDRSGDTLLNSRLPVGLSDDRKLAIGVFATPHALRIPTFDHESLVTLTEKRFKVGPGEGNLQLLRHKKIPPSRLPFVLSIQSPIAPPAIQKLFDRYLGSISSQKVNTGGIVFVPSNDSIGNRKSPICSDVISPASP